MEAAKAYTATKLGKGVLVLQCLHPGCEKVFPGKEVLRFIDLNVFKGIQRERLEVMIDRVGVRGLVDICSNCTTVVATGPIEDNPIYTCTNSECIRKCTDVLEAPRAVLTDSCRQEEVLLPKVPEGLPRYADVWVRRKSQTDAGTTAEAHGDCSGQYPTHHRRQNH